MNYIDIILIAIVLGFTIFGLIKGFLYSLLRFGSSVISIILAKILSEPVAEYFYTQFFHDGVISKLNELFPSGSVAGQYDAAIESAVSQLPSTIVGIAKQFNLYPDWSTLNISGELTVNDIEQLYLKGIFIGVLAVISIILLYLLFSLFLRIICYFINRIITNKDKHKIINSTNKILGAVFGLIKGIIPAGAIAMLLNLLSGWMNSSSFTQVVSNSKICGFIATLF